MERDHGDGEAQAENVVPDVDSSAIIMAEISSGWREHKSQEFGNA
jgi:hypothetical protein